MRCRKGREESYGSYGHGRVDIKTMHIELLLVFRSRSKRLTVERTLRCVVTTITVVQKRKRVMS